MKVGTKELNSTAGNQLDDWGDHDCCHMSALKDQLIFLNFEIEIKLRIAK